MFGKDSFGFICYKTFDFKIMFVKYTAYKNIAVNQDYQERHLNFKAHHLIEKVCIILGTTFLDFCGIISFHLNILIKQT